MHINIYTYIRTHTYIYISVCMCLCMDLYVLCVYNLRTYICAVAHLHFNSSRHLPSVSPREPSFVLREYNCFSHHRNKMYNVRGGHYRYFDKVKHAHRAAAWFSSRVYTFIEIFLTKISLVVTHLKVFAMPYFPRNCSIPWSILRTEMSEKLHIESRENRRFARIFL